ncbi:MAG TPA: hypothetical protein VG943_09835 [Caulobacterales bacterium]|nr:hypothetical protein [Caulobacterales bacterium]
MSIIAELARLLGPLWLIAIAATFVTSLCESARPQAAEGEERVSNGPLGAVGAVASLVTPFVLFLHAFWRVVGDDRVVYSPSDLIAHAVVRAAVIAVIFIVLLIATMGGAIPGWFIASSLPMTGRTLYRASPFLAVATLIFSFAFFYPSAARVVGLFLASR